MADVLQVEKREQLGSRATRRLRQSGRVPAVLYGHGQETESLSVSLDQVKALLRHRARTVSLTGAVKETAMLCDMQWDPLGIDVLHMDLMRVNLSEKVEVTVMIQVHGEPVGVREGGVLIENRHDVDIRCSAGGIPENLRIDVTELAIGDTLTAADLVLPEGVELMTPADSPVVHVEEVRSEEPETEIGDVAVEPDVISKGGPKEGEEED
ncbi:50S ribosomal protein L25 [Novipirellula artificiosorum]|uniref:Large ribosomal subunit protein bL25 n=1 Tax=Novipirellula artificiosorum TaxID=2528016 RepID=A0A5C6DFN2_9BACT|nr:50S ribosomal protein L25 [Novipirellula artificiosorum]TWU33779.1 50S ribosomal protein L25 [Novipirellula artificiosorum]